MGMFNRIVSILVFILAGVSVFFAFKLYEKREELKLRGDKMAKEIVNASTALGVGGGDDFKNKMTTAKLDHKSYKGLMKELAPLKTRAKELVDQRDRLAAALVEAANQLGVGETVGIEAVQLSQHWS